MTGTVRDRLIGCILIVSSALWCWATVATIPAVDEPGRLGSRGFPLGLSVLLGLLGLMLLFARSNPAADGTMSDAEGASTPLGAESSSVVVTLLLIVGYAVAMEQAGFLIATILVIVVALVAVLRVFRPLLVIGLALGMAGGIYLVFGKLLGVYLPHGQWIDGMP